MFNMSDKNFKRLCILLAFVVLITMIIPEIVSTILLVALIWVLLGLIGFVWEIIAKDITADSLSVAQIVRKVLQGPIILIQNMLF